MRLAVIVLAASVLAATPALAQTDPVQAAPAPAVTDTATAGDATADGATATEEAQPPQGERRICRTAQRTESRLRSRRERICGTQAEWDAMADQTAHDARQLGRVQGRQE